MKKISRILSLILAMVIAMSAFMTVSFAKTENLSDEYETYEKKLLVDLDIINETADMEESLTRAEFSKVFVKFLNIDVQGEVDMSDTADVEDQYVNAVYIRYMIDNGYLEKDKNRNFYPGSSLTYGDACRAIIKALGYEPWVTAKGITANSYVNCCKRIGVTADVKGINDTLTYANVVHMLFSALDVNLLEVDSYSSTKTTYTNKSGNTPLSSWYDIYTIEGILFSAENGTSSIIVDSVGKDYVRIGDNVYEADKSEIIDLLGYAVKGYYHGGRKNIKNKLVSVIPVRGANDVTYIDAEDIISFKNNAVTVDNKGKNKTYSVPISADVIYNGEAVESQRRSEAFAVENGTVMINNVNFGSRGVVVSITAYDNYIVGIADSNNKIIYDKINNTKKLDLSDEDISVKITNTDGSAIDFSQISTGDVLSVAKSFNSNRVSIVRSQNTVKGNLTGSGSLKTSEAYITIDGVKRKLAKNYRDSNEELPNLNTAVTVYLDMWNNAAYVIAADETGYTYGILKQVAEEGTRGFDDNYLKIKIMKTDGKMYIYDSIERIVIDNYRTKDPQEAENVLKQVTGISVYQPIRFMLNSDGKVSNIDTTNFNEEAGESPNSLRYIWRSYQNDYNTRGYGSDLQYKYWAGGNFGRKFYTAQWPTFFLLPRDNTAQDKYYVTESAIVDGRYFYVDALAVGRESLCADIVIQYYDASGDSDAGNYTVFGAITDVCETLDDDGVDTYKITYIEANGGEAVRFTDQEVNADEVPAIYGYTSDKYRLTPGDIASVVYDKSGAIVKLEMVYDAETKTWMHKGEYIRDGNMEGVVNCNLDNNEVIHGYVLQNNNTHMRVSATKPDEITDSILDAAYVADIQNSNIYVYNSGRNSISKTDWSEIVSYKYAGGDCSEVIFGGQGGVTPFVIIYE